MRIGIILFCLVLSLFAKSIKSFIDTEDVIRLLNFLEKKEVNMSVYNYNPFCNSIKKIKILTLSKPLKLKNSKKTIKLVIKAILNNKVYINNKWYKIGDRIGNYIVYKILDNAVLFKYGDKIIKKSLIKEEL